MAPLITREEARSLGELEDREAIEALIERAWRARVERSVPPRPHGAPNRWPSAA